MKVVHKIVADGHTMLAEQQKANKTLWKRMIKHIICLHTVQQGSQIKSKLKSTQEQKKCSVGRR